MTPPEGPGDRGTPPDGPAVTVVRLGHRPGRDDRMTTHVALTARALGADRVVLPDNATDAEETALDVTERFGGPFAVERTDAPGAALGAADRVAHLTMYGEPVRNVVPEIRAAIGLGEEAPAAGGHLEESPGGDAARETGADGAPTDGAAEHDAGRPSLAIAVGAGKVPFSVYDRADWNVGVTNQPHSEVAALAVFLDRLFDGAALDRQFADADRRVVPRATGKEVRSLDGADDAGRSGEAPGTGADAGDGGTDR